MKKLRQQVAAAMVGVMTMASTLSAAAGTVGTPSRNTQSITVTFDAQGGYWLSETSASSSNASPSDASSSEAEATPEKKTTLSKTFRKLQPDDEGRKFTSLADGRAEYDNIAEWDDVLPDKEGDLYQWYYQHKEDGKIPVFDYTEIYSNVILTAEWYHPSQITIEGISQELAPVPAGLGDRTMTIAPAEEKTENALQELLQQLPGKYQLEEGTEIFGLDIKVEGNGNEKVTLTMNVPSVLDPEKPILAIHIKDDGKAEVLPVIVSQDNELNWKMTFTAGSFSPFYFVNGKEMVKIKIKNVPNGYIAAYTRDHEDGYGYIDYSEKTFLPIDEEVELPVGTKIYYTAHGYEPDEGNQYGELESISLIDTETNEAEVLDRWGGSFMLNKNYELEAKFNLETYKEESSERNKFRLWVEPACQGNEGKYTGTPTVRIWNEDAKKYQTFEGWTLRALTAEDASRAGIDEHSVRDWELFDYDSDKNEITSKNSLELDYYRLPFVIGYQGEEYIYRNEASRRPYEVSIQVGGYIDFVHSYVKFDSYSSYEGLGGAELTGTLFPYADGDVWSKAEAAMQADWPDYPAPKMYNYEFKGWQDEKGVEYKPDTRLVPMYEDSYEFNAFTIFKNAAGKSYEVKAVFGDNSTNSGTNTNGNSSSSTSGGSGGRSRRNVDLTGNNTTYNHYTMTGSWIAGENGWKFLTNSGSYATNTWGLINNQWYFFDAAGNMVTGWYQVGGRWYYMNPAEGSLQGAMVVGWALDPNYNAWFFLTESGAMATDWQKIGDKWYYFNPISDGRKGAMAVNTYVGSDYVGSDGAWIPAN